MTVGSFFPAMVFYAMRVGDDTGGDHVEVVSFVPDDDYWDVIGDDPEDLDVLARVKRSSAPGYRGSRQSPPRHGSVRRGLRRDFEGRVR